MTDTNTSSAPSAETTKKGGRRPKQPYAFLEVKALEQARQEAIDAFDAKLANARQRHKKERDNYLIAFGVALEMAFRKMPQSYRDNLPSVLKQLELTPNITARVEKGFDIVAAQFPAPSVTSDTPIPKFIMTDAGETGAHVAHDDGSAAKLAARETGEHQDQSDRWASFPHRPGSPRQAGGTWLGVMITEKEEAKQYGAMWDNKEKQWYCPDGVDINLFRGRFLPD